MKIKDITPAEYACAVGLCPAVFKTDRGTLLIIGKTRSHDEFGGALAGRVGNDEQLVEIPVELLKNIMGS